MTEQIEHSDQKPPFLQFLPVPVMGQRKFAELAGVTTGVLEGWINRGYRSRN